MEQCPGLIFFSSTPYVPFYKILFSIYLLHFRQFLNTLTWPSILVRIIFFWKKLILKHNVAISLKLIQGQDPISMSHVTLI